MTSFPANFITFSVLSNELHDFEGDIKRSLTGRDDVYRRRRIAKCCEILCRAGKITNRIAEHDQIYRKYKKCSPATVYKWHARFRSGRDSIEDDPRSGRPAVVVCSVRDRVKDMVNCDRRITVRSIADELDVSVSTVHGILTDELGMSKVSARWVPRLLKESEKECRVRCSQEFLTRYET